MPTLEECMDTIIDYRGKTPTKTSSGVPLVTAKIVKNGRLEKATEFISASDYSKWMTRGMPKVGDVLLTTEAPLGEVAQVLDNKYLKYLLQSPNIQAQLVARSSGTTVSGIKQSELRKVGLSFPSLDDQVHIASILGSLDSKMELNRKFNATLEATVRAVSNLWIEESKQSKGWRTLAVSEAFEINPAERLLQGADAPYVEMSSLPTFGFEVKNVRMRPFSAGAKFRNGDTLLARITPCLENGKTAYVDFLNDGQVAWGSTEFIVMRAKNSALSQYGYILARDPAFRAFLIGKMTGSSGRQRVPNDALDAYQISIPPDDTAERFEKLFAPIFRRISLANRQNAVLSSLLNALLPKLISGELRVRDAERLLESA
jgi:type I restriction enzyme S subunit